MLDIYARLSHDEALELARERYLTTTELVRDAQHALQPPIWDYVAGGTESETTLKRNRQGIDQLALRPRVMCDVSTTDVSTEFLGQKLRLPLLLAPDRRIAKHSSHRRVGASCRRPRVRRLLYAIQCHRTGYGGGSGGGAGTLAVPVIRLW